ncbi:hypothetical protein CCACVL1_29107 [Corchorus capsularis]|uniref:Uncharacterized protein n=1 Tax=Corchorus capsularis TaxID=210143 RepID=A0A1R3G3N6_COCAP|nr:hypothetical protein CCACVL1_29107 [Corchorus capsularis]
MEKSFTGKEEEKKTKDLREMGMEDLLEDEISCKVQTAETKQTALMLTNAAF